MYSISTNTLIFILFDIVSFCSFNILCFAFFKKKVNLYKLLILCVFTVMVTTFIYIRYPSINIPCSITLKLINVFMYSSSIWKNILLVLFQSILQGWHYETRQSVFEKVQCKIKTIQEQISSQKVKLI